MRRRLSTNAKRFIGTILVCILLCAYTLVGAIFVPVEFSLAVSAMVMVAIVIVGVFSHILGGGE